MKQVIKKLSIVKEKVARLANMEVSDIIKNTTKVSVETLIGIIKSDPKDLFVTLGYIAQRLIADQHLDALLIEWEKLRDKGKIKDDYSKCRQAKYTLLELLKFLEEDIPDEDRYQILKRILLVAATEEKSTRDDIKPQQFMQIIKSLPSGCVIVLASAYRLSKSPPISDRNGRANTDEWLKSIANESGLEFPELVANYEQILVDKKLINSWAVADKSGVRITPHFRLTSLGYEIFKYIEHYDSFKIEG